MVQKLEKDKSIDHRERSKSPPRIPAISLSGHSLPCGPRSYGVSAMVKEKAGQREEEEEEKKGKVIEPPTGKTCAS